jgi:hypothetical protein
MKHINPVPGKKKPHQHMLLPLRKEEQAYSFSFSIPPPRIPPLLFLRKIRKEEGGGGRFRNPSGNPPD